MSQQHNTEGRVRFGARDWRHADWVGSYYPDDLPEDWQLGYYANELSAVLLPPDRWLEVDPGDLEGWADEVHDEFRFYLMLDSARDPESQVGRAAALGEKLGGLLWDGGPVKDVSGHLENGLPAGVRAWGDDAGIRIAQLDLGGLDLRARRAVLERLQPGLAAGDVVIILEWEGVGPAEVRELQTIAELLGIA